MFKNVRVPITGNVLMYARGKMSGGFADIAGTTTGTQKPIFSVLYSDKTWGFDQSEEPAQDPIYVINTQVNTHKKVRAKKFSPSPVL